MQQIKFGRKLERNVPGHVKIFMCPASLKTQKQVVDVMEHWLGMKPKINAFSHGNVHVTTKEGVTQRDRSSNMIVMNG